MKKIPKIVLSLVLILIMLTGCANKNTVQPTHVKNLKIITTIYPVYDWVKSMIKEEGDVTMLLDTGVDLHSYQPSTKDILKISNCDVFIYIGGQSDSWVEDALKESANKNITVINLMEILGDKAKHVTYAEGMEVSEHHHEDEHIWLSLKNAEIICKEIGNTLSELRPELNLEENTNVFIEKLTNLDNKYEKMIADAKNKTLLFGDRFPFQYLVEDYNLEYFAAFSGCSAETEASFETIAFLAKKIDDLKLTNILALENRTHKIPETIIKNTKHKNQSILTLNSLQSVSKEDINNGISYISVMEENLKTLNKALN